MGTGSAARRVPGQAGEEPEEAGTAESRQPQPVPWDGDAIPRPPVSPDEEHDQGEQPAEAGAPGDTAVDETADRAGADGAAPGSAEPSAAEGSAETAGSTVEAEGAAEPGSTHDAAGTSEAAGTGDAGGVGESGAPGADADGSALLDDEVTVVPGVPRYHRRGCILIRFLGDGDLETSTRRAAEAAGSVACKACQPDKPA